MVDMVAEPVCFKFIINTKKNKTFQMEWYVYYHDSNTQKIIKWNVFNHGTFAEKVNKLLQENLSRDEFADVDAKYGRQVVDAKSYLGLVTISIHPVTVVINTDNEDYIKRFNEICSKYKIVEE